MPVIRDRTVREVVVYTLEDVPEEYSFLTDDAIVTIVNGEVIGVTLHLRDISYTVDTGCIEWLKTLVGLANGLLEELQ